MIKSSEIKDFLELEKEIYVIECENFIFDSNI